MNRLEAIRKRTEAATAGPWLLGDTGTCLLVFADDDHETSVARLAGENEEANAEFIAKARADVPWLLDCIENRTWATVYERAAWGHDTGQHAGSEHPYSFCPRCEMEHPLGRFAQVVQALERVRHIASYHTGDDEQIAAIFKVAHEALTGGQA